MLGAKYGCFPTGKHQAHACSSRIFNPVVYNYMKRNKSQNRTWADLRLLLPVTLFFIITIVGFIQFYWLIHEQLLDNDDNIENNVIDFICMILYDDLTLIRCYLGICYIGGRYMTISNSMGLFSKHFLGGGGLFQSHIIKFFLLVNTYYKNGGNYQRSFRQGLRL